MGPMFADSACLRIAMWALCNMGTDVLWLDESRALRRTAISAVPRLELNLTLGETTD